MKIAVVEDEAIHADQLKACLDRFAEEKSLSMDISFYVDGLEFAESYQPCWDILFLDIALPHLNGMDVARRVRQSDQSVILIFITSMAQYAIHGYEVDAQDFLLKPVRYPQLALRLEKALSRLERDQERWLILPLEEGKRKVSVRDLLYVEVHNHHLDLITRQETYTIRSTLGEMEKKLEGCHFSRSSNSFLVNLRHVESFGADQVVVQGHSLPLSRTRRKPFMQDLSDYLGVEC